jgi:muramoyltetrapeptide carboxypeptidase
VLMNGEAVTYTNKQGINADRNALVQTEFRTLTMTPGKARGRLVGGNLTVLTTILGSPYLPDWDNTILFCEDVHEDLYRIDRMLTQLKLAGVLGRIKGFVFGGCSE